MARYRKVEVAVWTDAKVRALSAPKPNAQTLWLYLLTGPRTTSLPGLVVGRSGVMAADLSWTSTGFLAAFAELQRAGMVEADWDAGLVVLNRALLDSSGDPRESAKPNGPNTVKAWAKAWGDIPECALRDAYLTQLARFADAISDGIQAAFRKAFAKHLARIGHVISDGIHDAIPDAIRDAVSIQESGSGIRKQEQDPQSALPRVRSVGAGVPVPEPEALVLARRHQADGGWARFSDLRRRVAAELGEPLPRELHPQDPGRRELQARLLEAGPERSDADLAHVLAVLEAEAKAQGTLRWLDGGAFRSERWSRAIATSATEAAKPRAGRPAPRPGAAIGPAAPRNDHPTADDLVDFGAA